MDRQDKEVRQTSIHNFTVSLKKWDNTHSFYPRFVGNYKKRKLVPKWSYSHNRRYEAKNTYLMIYES